MFYIYVIYSESADKYYIGHTNDPERRLMEHNTTDEIKFTSKYRPWIILLSIGVSEARGDAIKVEKFIKRQKSRLFLSRLISQKDNPEYFERLFKNIID